MLAVLMNHEAESTDVLPYQVVSMSEKTQNKRASDRSSDAVLAVDRRATVDRRNVSPNDRRKKTIPVAFERRSGTDRRNVVERRRQVDPTTCERDYTEEEIDFMSKMDLYKRLAGRQFPTWSEVLEVLHAMGYRKIAEPTPLPGQPGFVSRRQQQGQQSS
ncbi:MAG: hypothetical protein U0796_23570 [Gemmatales bacterium]